MCPTVRQPKTAEPHIVGNRVLDRHVASFLILPGYLGWHAMNITRSRFGASLVASDISRLSSLKLLSYANVLEDSRGNARSCSQAARFHLCIAVTIDGRVLYFLRPLPGLGPRRFFASPDDCVPRHGSPANRLMSFSRMRAAAALAS